MLYSHVIFFPISEMYIIRQNMCTTYIQTANLHVWGDLIAFAFVLVFMFYCLSLLTV